MSTEGKSTETENTVAKGVGRKNGGLVPMGMVFFGGDKNVLEIVVMVA